MTTEARPVTDEVQQRRVRMGPRESQGWLLGMRTPQLLLVGLAGLCVLGLLSAGGFLAGLAWIVGIAICLSVAFIPLWGRNLDQYVPVIYNVMVQRFLGHHIYRGGPVRMGRTDTEPQLQLPGDLAHLELIPFDVGDGSGEQVAVIKDPIARTYTAVLAVEGDTFPLAASTTKRARIDHFDVLLAQLCTEGSVLARIQFLERTEPDSGQGLARDYARRGRADGSFAAVSYEQLTTSVSGVQQQHEAYVALSVSASKAASEIRRSGGGDQGAAAVLFTEIDKANDALRACDVEVLGWCPPRQLGFVIRTAYDPAARAMLDRRSGSEFDEGGGDTGLPSGVDPAASGPMRAENQWGHYRTDSALHRTWWVMQWPRKEVLAGFMQPVVLSTTCRRTVSLTFEPMSSQQGNRRVSTKLNKTSGDDELRKKFKRRTTRRHVVESQDMNRREDELLDGAGLFRMIGYISTSATDNDAGDPDFDALAHQSGEIERLAQQSSLEIRRLYGEHDQAFAAAALPFCRGLR